MSRSSDTNSKGGSESQLPWVCRGAISHIYKVNSRIVVKVPKPGAFQREKFRKEVEIYRILSQHPPCPQIVSCFVFGEKGIFLEYMRGMCLTIRMEINVTRNRNTLQVTQVRKLEPFPLRVRWMDDLARGASFLESLGLAHGDLRPENCLLDRNRLKITDFDCAAKIGSDFVVAIAPYARDFESEGGDEKGTAGKFGPRTEQFALGSVYYMINYGFEVYEDHAFDGNYSDHFDIVTDLLQKMIFPELNGDPAIDTIIDKCWHGRYESIADLAKDTAKLCSAGNEPSQAMPSEEFEARKKVCEEVVRRGTLDALRPPPQCNRLWGQKWRCRDTCPDDDPGCR
jgi:serine/threonine protein kinase